MKINSTISISLLVTIIHLVRRHVPPDYNNVQQLNIISQQKATDLEHGLTGRKEQIERLDAKVKGVEEFFLDNPNLAYQPLDLHSLEQSPCYPIIDLKAEAGVVWYNCKLHPDFVNINLHSIEHHCKSFRPELHRQILNILNQQTERHDYPRRC